MSWRGFAPIPFTIPSLVNVSFLDIRAGDAFSSIIIAWRGSWRGGKAVAYTACARLSNNEPCFMVRLWWADLRELVGGTTT